MNRKIRFSMIISLIIPLLFACSFNKADTDSESASQELQGLSLVEVYSTEDNTLIQTIEDRDILSQFNELGYENFDFTDNEERKNALKDRTSLYTIIAYKSPVAAYNDGDLEKLYTITVYKDTNTIVMKISQDAIKSFSVPSEYLTFYENITDKKIQFLKSLASFSTDSNSKQ